MFRDKSGTLWITLPIHNIELNKERIHEILDKCQQWQYMYDQDHLLWASEVSDEADRYFYEILEAVEQYYNQKNIAVDFGEHKKTSYLSILCEVFELLCAAVPRELHFKDITLLKKFLNTPEGKELEGWQEWEKFWNNRSFEE